MQSPTALEKQRNRVHSKAVKTQNPLHWARYRYHRNQVINEIRSSRQNYNKQLSAQINKLIPPGKWWRIVKSLSKLNNKQKPLPPLKVDGHTLFHSIDKANALNNFLRISPQLLYQKTMHLQDLIYHDIANNGYIQNFGSTRSTTNYEYLKAIWSRLGLTTNI